jgi:hypothetical protein
LIFILLRRRIKNSLAPDERARNIFMMKRDLSKATISHTAQPLAAHVIVTGGLMLAALRSVDSMKT